MPEQKQGYVYIVHNKYNGFIKIGYSTAPKYRVNTLASQEPALELIGYVPGTRYDEKALHHKYKQYRSRGEWFLLPEHAEKQLFHQFRENTVLKDLPMLPTVNSAQVQDERSTAVRIRVTNEQFAALTAARDRTGLSLSKLIRLSVDEFLPKMDGLPTKPLLTGHKICSKCGEDKDLDAYHNSPTSADGKHAHCKDCASELNKQATRYKFFS